jgi:uncharacterized protein
VGVIAPAAVAPLTETGVLGERAGLAAALALGVAFGWCLERAGLGNARKLMGQFYHTDLAVFKVMFSAIVTAMLGLFWLARLGLLDPALVAVPETWLAPQLVGGVVFGAGLALAGLCPGTSCVAAASGRADGLAVMGGFFAGVLAMGAAVPAIDRFYRSTARGVDTLPARLGVPDGVAVLAVVAVALAGFAFAGHVERRTAARQGSP